MIYYIIPTTKLITNIPIVKKFKDTDNTSRKICIEFGYETIFKKYNKALDELKDLKDDDIVVFMHDDIDIKDEWFEKKLKLYFKYKTDVSIAGVIGTTHFTDVGGWWTTNRHMLTRGRIIQGFEDGREYTMTENGGMDDYGIVSVDGCILFMIGKYAKQYRFDEETYNGYHFYDSDACFTALENKQKIGIIDVLIKHKSEGPLSFEWEENRQKFLEKWRKKGYIFPVTINQFI